MKLPRPAPGNQRVREIQQWLGAYGGSVANAYVVNAESKNAEAAMTWINFLASSSEAAKLRIAAGWDLPAITDQSVLQTYLDIEKPASREVVFESLNYLTIPPIIEQNSLMSDIITKHLQEAATGAVTVEQAMDDCQAELEASIQLG